MKLNLIDTFETGGIINSDKYRVKGDYPVIQMHLDQETQCLVVDDINFDQQNLPVPVSDLVKKVVLTYNGIDYPTNQVYETMVYDSQSIPVPDPTKLDGYINSNMWKYCPSNFKACADVAWCPVEGGDIISSNPPGVSVPTVWPENTCSQPYDWSHGIVVKKFLVGEANITNEYYVRYSAPEVYDIYPSNVRGNNVYLDGWYSSYYYNIFKWGATSVPSYTRDMIVWHNDKFWKSLTGSGIEPGTTGDWTDQINLQDWLNLIYMTQGDDTDDIAFAALTQYLVTYEVNNSILNEVVQMAANYPLDFGTSCITQWVRLTQKKAGAVANFYNENFKDAQRIIEQCRDLFMPPQSLGFSGIRANQFFGGTFGTSAGLSNKLTSK